MSFVDLSMEQKTLTTLSGTENKKNIYDKTF